MAAGRDCPRAAAMKSAAPVSASATNLAELPEGMARLAAGGAGWLIAIGLIGSGLLALVVVSLSAAWGSASLWAGPTASTSSPARRAASMGVYLVEVIPAAAVVLVSADFVRLCVGSMVFNVVVLALPLSFLVLLTSDRELLGDLANSRPRAALLWVVTLVLLASGVFGMIQYLTVGWH